MTAKNQVCEAPATEHGYILGLPAHNVDSQVNPAADEWVADRAAEKAWMAASMDEYLASLGI